MQLHLKPGELAQVGFITIFPTLVLLTPGSLIREAGRWAWIPPLVAGAAFALAVTPMFRCPLLCRDGLIGASEQAFGRWLGKLAQIGLWFALIAYGTVILRQISLMIQRSYIYADVPVALLTAMAAILSSAIAAAGVRVVFRISGLIIWPLLAAYLILLGMAAPFLTPVWAQPLLPPDLTFLTPDSISRISFVLVEALLLLLWTDRLEPSSRQYGPQRSAWLAIGGAVAAFLPGLYVIVTYWGPERAGELLIPLQSTADDILYANFIQGTGSLLFPMLLIGASAKLGFFQACLARLGRSLLPAGSRLLHAGLPGIAIFAGSLTLFPDTYALERSSSWIGYTAGGYILLFYVFVLLVSALRPTAGRSPEEGGR